MFTNYKSIGKVTFTYELPDGTFYPISCIFKMSTSNKRKVEFEYDKDLMRQYNYIYKVSVKTHPFYHKYIVPFLHKTPPVDDYETAKLYVEKLVMINSGNVDDGIKQPQTTTDGNVIYHTFRNIEETQE